jgi:hypothetical protein
MTQASDPHSRTPEPPEAEQEQGSNRAADQEQDDNQAVQAPLPDWLAKIAGSFENDPVFLEILEYGREFRTRDRPPETEDP